MIKEYWTEILVAVFVFLVGLGIGGAIRDILERGKK